MGPGGGRGLSHGNLGRGWPSRGRWRGLERSSGGRGSRGGRRRGRYESLRVGRSRTYSGHGGRGPSWPPFRSLCILHALAQVIKRGRKRYISRCHHDFYRSDRTRGRSHGSTRGHPPRWPKRMPNRIPSRMPNRLPSRGGRGGHNMWGYNCHGPNGRVTRSTTRGRRDYSTGSRSCQR